MPQLRWNKYDFIECLAVLPEVHDEVVFEFAVTKDGMRLIVTIWPFESVVMVNLGAEAVPRSGMGFALFVRGDVNRREYRGREWLEFSDYVVAPSRFSYLEQGNLHDRARYPRGQSIRIAVSPHIAVEWLRG